MLKAASSLRDTIRPDIMPFVKIHTILKEDRSVVEINVEVGSGRPYYLQEKGLKPTGVYVRRGSASQPLSDDGIREMILQSSGKSYEKCRSMNQELTFENLKKEMAARNQELGASQMRMLHLINEEGSYTNLALLLSDQCEHATKIAIFQGSDKTIFRDRKEFTGSLLEQLNEAYTMINLFNRTKATFSGLQRVDKLDYPQEAVREALLSCIVHRDYSFSGSTLINLYDDRIEFVSLGGLVSGLSMEAICMGVSQSRNPRLADVFYRMQLIESFGTGIGKILRLYSEEEKQPKFDSAKGAFRVILPNCNEDCLLPDISGRNTSSFLGEEMMPIADPKAAIYQFAKKRGVVRRRDVERLIGSKSTKAFILLRELCDEGKLYMVGKGRGSYYKPIATPMDRGTPDLTP